MTIRQGWRKSSYSTNTDNCVEVSSELNDIRDSKDPYGPSLNLDRLTFQSFVDAVKSDRFQR